MTRLGFRNITMAKAWRIVKKVNKNMVAIYWVILIVQERTAKELELNH